MRHVRICSFTLLLFAGLVGLTSCSKQSPQQTSEPSTPASQPAAQPAAQPAPSGPSAQPASTAAPSQPATTASGAPGGPLATEKHRLTIANYAGVSVTASINGGWVGQWDAHTNVPLDSVVQGRNQLTIELQAEPKNEIRLEVDAERDGHWVNLLRLNFQGKAPGTYNYNFVAK